MEQGHFKKLFLLVTTTSQMMKKNNGDDKKYIYLRGEKVRALWKKKFKSELVHTWNFFRVFFSFKMTASIRIRGILVILCTFPPCYFPLLQRQNYNYYLVCVYVLDNNSNNIYISVEAWSFFFYLCAFFMIIHTWREKEAHNNKSRQERRKKKG